MRGGRLWPRSDGEAVKSARRSDGEAVNLRRDLMAKPSFCAAI